MGPSTLPCGTPLFTLPDLVVNIINVNQKEVWGPGLFLVVLHFLLCSSKIFKFLFKYIFIIHLLQFKVKIQMGTIYLSTLKKNNITERPSHQMEAEIFLTSPGHQVPCL